MMFEYLMTEMVHFRCKIHSSTTTRNELLRIGLKNFLDFLRNECEVVSLHVNCWSFGDGMLRVGSNVEGILGELSIDGSG